MKIHSFQNTLAFKKQLVAEGNIINKDKPTPCQIYEILPDEDELYFENLKKSDDWYHNHFLRGVACDLKNLQNNTNIYSIENSSGKCLGYVETMNNSREEKDILLLETCPTESYQSTDREYKYIGETLISFVVGLAEKENIKKVIVSFPSYKAIPFYTEKCGFINDTENLSGLFLNNCSFNKLKEQNQKNTSALLKILDKKKLNNVNKNIKYKNLLPAGNKSSFIAEG